MISTAERAKRSLKTGKRTFFLVVAILSLAFCLLGQMVLSFYSFYQAHRGVMGDEATIFIDPTLNDKETEKLVQKIQSLTPASSMREIQPADVLEKDILKLVEARTKVPLILALQFPADVSVSEMREHAADIKKMKGVEAVTANFEWIEKRHTLREAIALGIIALAVPTVLLVAMLIVQSSLRLRSFMSDEQRLFGMLGASRFSICAPQMLVAFWASLLSCLFGSMLLALSLWGSIPLLEEAFEVKLLADVQTCAAVIALIALMTIFATVFSSMVAASLTKPLKF